MLAGVVASTSIRMATACVALVPISGVDSGGGRSSREAGFREVFDLVRAGSFGVVGHWQRAADDRQHGGAFLRRQLPGEAHRAA
ncbi:MULTISPECIES: hypothetical protein [unclassified Micromonospora]|uniref:hypothetical protein n=1 Tax=unclassified Micromonospora TaxID=2617518 RepID=UPI0033B4F222